MTDEEEELNIKDNSNGDIKIQFGEKITTCFACGQKINKTIKVCPYCKTVQRIDTL